MLNEALRIRERMFGPSHPLVAATLNELGNTAVRQRRLDDAEAAYARMVDIYRTAYQDYHYLIGTATSNLANVFMERKQYPRAEELFREAVRRFTETQGADHVNTGIARIKLGRSLLRQRRFADGAVESFAGYEILSPQMSPSVSYLRAARRDLIADYDSLGQPEKAARFRAEIADTASKR
jgi:serine/threonine-protein kinase